MEMLKYLAVCHQLRHILQTRMYIRLCVRNIIHLIMSSLKSLATTCRACLRETLDSYFEMNKQCYFATNKTFSDIFNFCTHFELEVNDTLPQRICQICAQDLHNTYAFLRKVLTNNTKLMPFTECHNRSKENGFDNKVDDIKDPLENATDDETKFNAYSSKSDMECNNEDDDYFRISIDNADSNVADAQLNNSLISALSDSDYKSECDFFKSVESHIFPQGCLKCKICSKSYFTNAGLQCHMDIHLPKKKTINKNLLSAGKCIKKPKTTTGDISEDEGCNEQNMKLTKEMKTKQAKPKKMFPCEVCGKQMISASKLRYHMVMHTGEKDYLCTICPKAYSTIYALKHHMRAHTGERPYECTFCSDRFLRPTTLKSHMRRHTGERPYGCDICGKRFIQHSSMATHMKLNHMDKTIPCPYCEKKYARQTDLNTHLLSHRGDKPFGCQLCPSRFTRQSNLNKHMNQHHNNVNIGDKKSKNKTTIKASTQDLAQQIGCEIKVVPDQPLLSYHSK